MPAETAPRAITLLGPQRLAPTLREAVEAVGIAARARLAVVTAGWEEREDEDRELGEHLGGRSVNLQVFARVDDIYRRDPELHRGVRERHDRMRELQDLYRLRLDHALGAARALMSRQGPAHLLDPEREDAIAAVRALDQHHAQRLAEVLAEFEQRWQPGQRDHVAAQRREIRALLADCEALCIAGGHVPILRSRLLLLDVLGQNGARPVFAWSGGAMVLTERVVAFHDSPPQGAGNAEVLMPGLGVARGVVALPHARRRLQLDDRARVALFARRFAPALCVALDERTRLTQRGGTWRAAPGTRQLAAVGGLTEIEAA